jgi:hypothetical protein
MSYVYELIFLLSLVAIAIIHAFFIRRNKEYSHLLWGGISLTIGAILFYCSHYNVLLGISFVFIRVVVFSPLLNLLRRPPKPFFYLNPESNENKINFDGFIQKIWIPCWIGSLIVLIILQFDSHL